MKKIGVVKTVQIQRMPLKVGEGQARIYRPDPIQQVIALYITPDGIFGQDGSDEKIIDVHHINHPSSRFRGDNRVSIGFSYHYESIRARFGSHLKDGLAGENIIAELEEPIDVEGRRLFIESKGQSSILAFEAISPAPPCREFSNFCAGRTLHGEELKQTLLWLDGGRRGYYAALAQGSESGYVKLGDILYYEQMATLQKLYPRCKQLG